MRAADPRPHSSVRLELYTGPCGPEMQGPLVKLRVSVNAPTVHVEHSPLAADCKRAYIDLRFGPHVFDIFYPYLFNHLSITSYQALEEKQLAATYLPPSLPALPSSTTTQSNILATLICPCFVSIFKRPVSNRETLSRASPTENELTHPSIMGGSSSSSSSRYDLCVIYLMDLFCNPD